MKAISATKIDFLAISLSSICVFHCLALPVLATILPFLGLISENEIVHKALIFLTVPISVYALVWQRSHNTSLIFWVLAILGLSLLITSVVFLEGHVAEESMTVIGACALASAHLLRLRKHFSR